LISDSKGIFWIGKVDLFEGAIKISSRKIKEIEGINKLITCF